MNDLQLFGTENSIERRSELAIIVVNEKVQRLLVFLDLPDELPCLLGHPRTDWMRRATREVNATTA